MNKNVNSPIRQHFPKGTNISKLPDAPTQFVMDSLNDQVLVSCGAPSPRALILGQQVDLLAS